MASWWVVSSIVFTALVVFVAAPGMPPGNGTVEASGQVVDNTVLMGLSTPVAMAVLVPVLGHAVSQIHGGDHVRTDSGA